MNCIKSFAKFTGSTLLATFLSLVLPVIPSAQAMPGYAMLFNGTNNYVWVDRPVADDFTIEFWFNSTQVAGTNTQWWQGMGLVDGEVSGAYADFGVSLGAGTVVFGTGGAGDVSIRSGVVADGKWHHVAATRVRTNGLMRLYVDGALAASNTGSTVALSTPAQMRFGCLASGANYYRGLLDEVKIWSVARSQGQIQAGMLETPGRADADLAGYWPFREGAGGMQTADFAGHGQHGRMVNRPVWRPSSMVWAKGIQLAGTLLTTNECHEAFVDAGAGLECGPVHLSSRSYQSQGVRADGTVAGWGATLMGQTNMPPPEATNAVATATSGLHSLALRADGTVVGWGDNQYNKASVPGTITNAVAVAAGNFGSAALRADGTVTAWGWGQTGEFPGTFATNVVAIGSGYTHNIYLQGDGTVGGWGLNPHGELDVPAGATNVVAISVGDDHSLALRADGSVLAWGYNDQGQTNVPASATNVVAISAGDGHSLVLKGDGTVLGWGGNANGELNVPAGVSNVVGVVAGRGCSFVLLEDGRTVGWGGNFRNVSKIPAGLGLVAYPVFRS